MYAYENQYIRNTKDQLGKFTPVMTVPLKKKYLKYE